MEQNFTNDLIDTTSLPKFEEVHLTPLHPDYWKVILYNILISYAVGAGGIAFLIYFVEELHLYSIPAAIVFAVVLLITVFINRISFRNRGFAFRKHDVIFRSGAISLTTSIIPYNRIQHAALYEGWLARKYGLAAVEIYTAGGAGSDIKIPGLEKEHAENIKQLLMGKILNQESND